MRSMAQVGVAVPLARPRRRLRFGSLRWTGPDLHVECRRPDPLRGSGSGDSSALRTAGSPRTGLGSRAGGVIMSERRPGSVRGALHGSTLGILLLAGAALGQPPNDECTGAIPVSTGITLGFSNVGANDSVPPATPGGTCSQSDVWFSYTATCTGTATVNTCGGTNFSSRVQVFEGTCGSLGSLGCDNVQCGFGSSVNFQATIGSTYLVRVGGGGGAEGTFGLTIFCTPVNDVCAAATQVYEGLNTGLANSGASATFVPWTCTSAGADVWFTYTPGCTGSATVDTCTGTGFDTVIQAFSGTCAALTPIGCDDNGCGPQSQVTFPVTSGVPVLLRVGGVGAQQGNFTLNVTCPCPTCPPNDTCSSPAPLLDGLNACYTTINAGNSAPPWLCVSSGSDVWFTYVATCTGTTTFDTCTPWTNFDTTIQAFTGQCGALSSLACFSGGTCNGAASIAIPTVAGTTYRIRVGGDFGLEGNFGVQVTPSCPAPGPPVVFAEDFEGGGLGAYSETTCAGTPGPSLWHPDTFCAAGIPLPASMGG